MLHTIIDLNDIFAQQEPIQLPYATVTDSTFKTIGNCILEGRDCEGRFQINRVISTNPHDYLDPKYALGKYL